jgi:hypothetical protein
LIIRYLIRQESDWFCLPDIQNDEMQIMRQREATFGVSRKHVPPIAFSLNGLPQTGLYPRAEVKVTLDTLSKAKVTVVSLD